MITKLFLIDNIVKTFVWCYFCDVFVTSADGCQALVGNVNVVWISVHSIVSVYVINFLM